MEVTVEAVVMEEEEGVAEGGVAVLAVLVVLEVLEVLEVL